MSQRFNQFPCIGLTETRGRTGIDAFPDKAINAPFANVLLQSPTKNFRTKVTAFPRPVTMLNNASIHVYEVKGSVRSGIGVHGPEIRIGGGDEFEPLLLQTVA